MQRHIAQDGCPGQICLRRRGVTTADPTREEIAARWKETIPATLQNTNGMLGEITRLQQSAGVPLTFFAELTPDRPEVRYFRAGVDRPVTSGFRNQPAPQPGESGSGPRTFILTWNPDTEGWPEDDYRKAIARSERGLTVKGRWSVGSRTGGIQPGDRAFMLRQRRDRGIIASGRFTSEVFQDEHWEDSKRAANYAQADWEKVLDPSDRLPTEILEQTIPDAHWTPQGSGIELRPPANGQLEELWAKHLAKARPKVWCVRAGSQGEALDDFVRDGVVAIGWPKIGDPRQFGDFEARKAAVAREYPEEAPGSQAAGSFRRFLDEMAIGDIVITPRGDTVRVGRVQGQANWNGARGRFPTYRLVEWIHVAPIESLPRPGRDSLSSRLTIFEIQDRDLIHHLRGLIEPPSEADEGAVQTASADDPLARLAADLLVSRESLAEMAELLEDKGQVIFYGPPGTGKTYIARKLATHLTGSPERVELVQFHPSYAYEDFVEGFRPSGSGFALTPGPLKRLAQRAEDDPENRYVLVIDEINRGNVARVFGELYFLLDYRGERIKLQYSPAESFRLPKNLWIIATMNTADRSIGLLDAALRRRFYFFGFFPDTDPIKGLLRRWLERHHPDLLWVADRVDRANDQLKDRDAAIGPSYFMSKSTELDEHWVEVIWARSVLPYIEERLFGERDRVAGFTLDALGRATAAEPVALVSDANESTPGGAAEP